ncbi:MAG: hypothetical protein ACREEC_01085 [Thermoplasmata archaeon]
MPNEMLSGPDLGAGFLHQLSTERNGDRTTFTYHAQEGGADANGPPKGPLDVLGFVHPTSPCQFGGPRCWHRRFLLPFAETPRVRQCYNRNRFVLQTMVDQAYSAAPAAIENALGEVVTRLSGAFPQGSEDWYIGGSTAAWLLGATVVPHDIDVGTSREGVDRLGVLLADYLIEPVSTTDWSPSRIVRGARAFVGTFATGARVEWAVALESGAEQPLDEWSGRPDGARLLSASFRGRSLRVTRPEYALVRAVEKGSSGRATAIAELMRRCGVDRELLGVLLDRSPLEPARRESVLRLAGA